MRPNPQSAIHNPQSLEVRLHGEPIGTLTHIGSERTLFAFNESYIASPQRPTLGLHFKDAYGELRTDFRAYRTQLMPFFSNLLPEGPLRKWLAEMAGVHPQREFFLLWALGQDLAGAITVTSAQGDAWPQEAGAVPRGKAAKTLGLEALRFSLAGVQLKFSALKAAGRGVTIPVDGVGGNWIVKLPSQQFAHVPENEFSMMTLAQKVGIAVPAIDLIDIGAIENLPAGMEKLGGKAFLIERFDRDAQGNAIHIEDFAQVFGVYPEDKYKNASLATLARVVAIECGQEDAAEFIRRMTFNVLIGNGDMHLKNWSLMYPDRRHARLAPAYDFISTIGYPVDDEFALKFSRTREWSGYTRDELEHLAARAQLPARLVLDTVRETVELFMEHWAKEKKHLPLASGVVKAIDKHLQRLPVVREG